MNAMRWLAMAVLASLWFSTVHAKDGGADADGQWMELGQVEISSDDKDNHVQIQAEDRAVSAIRLRVGRKAANVKTLTVAYEGGSTQTIQINQTLEAGSMTKIFDLEGKKRRIEKIVIKASVAKKEDGKSMLIVYGKKS